LIYNGFQDVTTSYYAHGGRTGIGLDRGCNPRSKPIAHDFDRKENADPTLSGAPRDAAPTTLDPVFHFT
jgi:hypothetical protein